MISQHESYKLQVLTPKLAQLKGLKNIFIVFKRMILQNLQLIAKILY